MRYIVLNVANEAVGSTDARFRAIAIASEHNAKVLDTSITSDACVIVDYTWRTRTTPDLGRCVCGARATTRRLGRVVCSMCAATVDYDVDGPGWDDMHCQQCGEVATWIDPLAEVVTPDGRRLIVHAECVMPGWEVA